MASIGFTNYDVATPQPQPTTAELVASLTSTQRGQILDGFSNKILPQRLKSIIFVDPSIIRYLYARIDAIEEWCRLLLRGELVETPEIVDPETGEITTPAVYVTPPTTLAGLKTAVNGEFGTEFTSDQSDSIVDKMIAMSKSDGTGDALYYLSKVTE